MIMDENAATGGLPDMRISVRQVFGIDSDMEAPAYSSADPHVPDIDPDYLFDRDTDPFAGRAPDVVDILVVQDREEPGAQIGAGLPEMLFGNRPGQAALDEIVGSRHIPGQGTRIAAQPRNLCLKQPAEIVHREPHRCFARPRATGGSTLGRKI